MEQLEEFHNHDDGSIGAEIIQILNSGKLPSLKELRFSVDRGHRLNISMIDPEKIPWLETLSLNRFITSWTQLDVLAHKVKKWKLKNLSFLTVRIDWKSVDVGFAQYSISRTIDSD